MCTTSSATRLLTQFHLGEFAGGGITCTRTADKSAYWIPTAKWIDKSGTRTLTVDKGLFNYRLASKDPNVDVQPHPDGLKVVTVQGSNVEWRCANGTWSTYPPAQCTNGTLVVRIKFPTASLKTRTGSRYSTAPTTARTWSTPSRRAPLGGRSARASTQPFYRSSK